MKHKYSIDERIKKYDKEIDYISGYEDCTSIVKCYCHRCNNFFSRKWSNLARNNTEYCCPICQIKLSRIKGNGNRYIKPLDERENHFIETIKNTQPHIKYISGFKDNKSLVLVECKHCGNRFYRTVDRLMRKNKKVQCKECNSKELESQKVKDNTIKTMLKEQKKYIIKIKRNHNIELNKIYSSFKKNTVYIKICAECGNECIEQTKSKYCSFCKKKKRKKHSSKSLHKLYKRDNGICQLCHKECDWNDKQIINGTTIVGNNYPSIDHVVPLAKGGTDDWNNLQLAHFRCNWLKGLG